MKKVLLVAAVAGLAMASCRKERVCECTSSSTIAGTTYTAVTTTKVKSTKKDATEWCENGSKNSSTTVNGVAVPSTGTGPNCAIK